MLEIETASFFLAFCCPLRSLLPLSLPLSRRDGLSCHETNNVPTCGLLHLVPAQPCFSIPEMENRKGCYDFNRRFPGERERSKIDNT